MFAEITCMLCLLLVNEVKLRRQVILSTLKPRAQLTRTPLVSTTWSMNAPVSPALNINDERVSSIMFIERRRTEFLWLSHENRAARWLQHVARIS